MWIECLSEAVISDLLVLSPSGYQHAPETWLRLLKLCIAKGVKFFEGMRKYQADKIIRSCSTAQLSSELACPSYDNEITYCMQCRACNPGGDSYIGRSMCNFRVPVANAGLIARGCGLTSNVY